MSRRARARVLVTLFITALYWCWAVAESRLNFPRLSNEAGTITGVAIVNSRNQAATIVVTAYGDDGEILSGDGIRNPVEMIIEGNQQLALLTTDFFGTALPESTIGWFSVQSETNDLTGFFMFLDLEFSIFDGADLPVEAPAILLSEVRFGGGFSSEINIVNPGDLEADIELELWGEQSAVRQLLIPPHGVRRFEAGEFFGLNDSGATSFFSLTATSNTDIAAFELVKGPGDLLGLNAVPVDEPAKKVFFPQIAVLGGLESRLTLSSRSRESVIVTIKVYQPDGTLYDQQHLQTNPVNRVIGPLGLLSEDLETMFGFSGKQTLDGWLEVEASARDVFGTLSYSIPAIGSVASVAGSARGLTRALFSHIATDLGFFTGLAFLNAGALTATVEIVTLRPDGTELGSFVTVLRPGERVSKLIEELISGAAGQAGGFIWIKSDVPLFLTSIFGSLATGVLSNIPPQSVPVLFDPTPGDGEFRLDPPLAILEPAREQSFEVEGIAGPLAWSVNGIPGGNNIVGNVDGGGTYTAPALIPENLPVTVAASSQQQAVGASVDLLSPEDFRFDLGVLQSVAYLSGLQRLFTAELIVVPGPQESGGPAQGASSTRIVDVTGDTGQPLAILVGKEVAKMISFTADNGLEYLLMSATNTGQVLRVDPASGAALEIALGLDQPTTLALDPATGDLLVAESEEVTSIDSAALNAGLTAGAGSYTAAGASAKERLFKVSNGRLVVDECTSNVFVAQPDQDRIAEFVRLTGALRTVVENLENPRALLGFHRNQVSCPRSFHLLVGEKGAERISLVIPSTGQTRPWIDSAGVVDITFVPEGTPFAPGGAVILARDEGSGGGLSLIPFPRVYSERALNPPRKLLPGPCRVAQVTETEDAQNRVPVITGDGSQIFFVSDTDLVGTNGDGNHEIFRFALDTREFAQVTDTTGAESHHPAPDSDGSSLAFLSTANLTGSDPQGTNLYVLSGSGIVRAPGTPEPGESFQLDRAGGRLVYTSSDNVAGQNADGNPEIRVWDSSFGSVQLTETVGGANGLAGISGNGAWVVFVSTANIEGLNPGGDEVVFLHEMASLTTSLVGVVRSNGEGLSGIPPLVGFDASHILFSSFEDLTGENPKRDRALFVFDRVGQTMRQVADDLDLADLSDISAGESILAMSSNKNPVKLNKDNNREIFLIDLPGEQILQVTRSLEVTNQKATINRDASLLTFRSTADFNGQNRDGNFEIFVADCSDIQ